MIELDPETRRNETRRAESGDGVSGRRQRAPLHQIGVLGSAVSGVRGRAPENWIL